MGQVDTGYRDKGGMKNDPGMSSEERDRRPFAGIKILDVTRVVASPFASYQLGLLGADVLKIEDPRTRGDTMRYRRGSKPEYGAAGMATYYLSQSANKRSMTLDLRTEAGQEVFRRLAADADVVIENLRTGTMARYGLGYEDLRTLNPRLVYCSLTGYGQTGPKRTHGAYDPVVQAASGLMSVNGMPNSLPVKLSAPVIDYGAGLSAAFGISSALFERSRSGLGQLVDVAMLDSAIVLMGALMTEAATTGNTPVAHGNLALRENYCNVCLPCKDGQIAIAAMEAHQRHRLWEALGMGDTLLAADFRTEDDRIKNAGQLQALMTERLITQTADYWEETLNAVNVPAMRVRNISETVAMEQVRQRGVLHTMDGLPGVTGSVTFPLVPFQLSAGGARVDSAPPSLGQHTEAVLGALGYDADAIAELRERAVI